jgi:hypothetical protein
VPTLIRLAWPPRALFPNARSPSKFAHAASVKRYRRDCYWDAHSQGVRPLLGFKGKLGVRITFHPPKGVRFDRDNGISAFKNAQDGLADLIGIDDGKWLTEYAFGERVDSGLVVVEVLP